MADRIQLPLRAVVLSGTIEADTLHDLASHLINLATQVERGEMGESSVSGGYSSGHILKLEASDRPTHDEWADQLRAYLESSHG